MKPSEIEVFYRNGTSRIIDIVSNVKLRGVRCSDGSRPMVVVGHVDVRSVVDRNWVGCTLKSIDYMAHPRDARFFIEDPYSDYTRGPYNFEQFRRLLS